MKKNPILSVSTISSAVAAVVALLVAFGVPISEDQKVAILGVVAVLAPLVVLFIRNKFTLNSDIVEREQDGVVLAGDANELPTDTQVRDAGTLAQTE